MPDRRRHAGISYRVFAIGRATLEELNLAFTQVSDRGLAHLAGIDSLKHLNLRHTHVSEIGLSQMRPAKLDYLELGYTDVKSLEFLQPEQAGDWSILRDLGVKATPLDDAGLAAMPLLPNLQYLWLADTKITGKSARKDCSACAEYRAAGIEWDRSRR